MNTQEILEIMKSPNYFVGVAGVRFERDRSNIQMMAEVIRNGTTQDEIQEHLFLLEGDETPQQAASIILAYLMETDDELDISLEEKVKP